MVDGSQTAFQVVNDIEAHDSIATDALKLATQGRYADAIVKLVGASAALSDAQTVAAQLSTVTDTSTLTTWLTRTQAWDDAARLLWQTTIDNKGAINAQVTAALRNEANARALLPDNNNVLQVVMYEVAGNMTSNGISIETARGALNAAMTDLTGGSILGS
jgi:nitrous oxide reductase accessory protein NosL